METEFSKTMSRLRRERGLSQRRAAADLHISQALLSHYENGAREPGLSFVCRACDYYGVTADFLLGRTDGGETSREQGLQAVEALLQSLRTALEETEKAFEELKESL